MAEGLTVESKPFMNKKGHAYLNQKGHQHSQSDIHKKGFVQVPTVFNPHPYGGQSLVSHIKQSKQKKPALNIQRS